MEFHGSFDGKGHTISNITVTNSQEYGGLFGFVRKGTLKNINMEKVSVKATQGAGSIAGGVGAGVGAGNDTNPTIQNISVWNGDVVSDKTKASYAGGIVGYVVNRPTFKNCFFQGSVSGAEDETSWPKKLRQGAITGSGDLGD